MKIFLEYSFSYNDKGIDIRFLQWITTFGTLPLKCISFFYKLSKEQSNEYFIFKADKIRTYLIEYRLCFKGKNFQCKKRRKIKKSILKLQYTFYSRFINVVSLHKEIKHYDVCTLTNYCRIKK